MASPLGLQYCHLCYNTCLYFQYMTFNFQVFNIICLLMSKCMMTSKAETNVFFIKKESPRVAWDVWVLSRQTFLTDTTCAHYYSLRSKTQSSFVTKRSTFGNAKDQIKCEINSQKMNCKRCHDVGTYTWCSIWEWHFKIRGRPYLD